MPTLYLPEAARTKVARAADAEQRQMVEEFERITGLLEHYNQELRQLDEHLSIVLAKPNTTVEGLKPGFYHLVRMRPGHPAWIKPIEGPNGEWRDLDSSVYDLAAEDDLWNDRRTHERRKLARKAREARERQVAQERADRAREFDERWKAANTTSILVSKDIA